MICRLDILLSYSATTTVIPPLLLHLHVVLTGVGRHISRLLLRRVSLRLCPGSGHRAYAAALFKEHELLLC